MREDFIAEGTLIKNRKQMPFLLLVIMALISEACHSTIGNLKVAAKQSDMLCANYTAITGFYRPFPVSLLKRFFLGRAPAP